MDMKLSTTQRQTLSSRMIMSAEILQMNNQELENFIKEQEMENPLVEIEHITEEEDRSSDILRKLEWLNAADEQNRIYYRAERDEEREQREWNRPAKDEETLAEFVYSQIAPLSRDKKDEEILYYLANSLDSRGYLEEGSAALSARFGIPEQEADRYLNILRSAEPAGVGARDLKDCLSLQLDRLPESSPVAKRIVADFLDLLGRNQIRKIAELMKISMDEVRSSCDVIKELNPKPGNGFSSRENLIYIRPDVTVVKFQEHFQILLNDNAYPKIAINSYYCHLLREDIPEDTREYISDRLRQAEWVVNCISQRGTTLTNVTEAIVRFQRPFFEKGPGNRLPLKLSDVADELGIHESTVSRTLRGKYIQCPWGIYPLNYFFPKAVGNPCDEKVQTPEKIQRYIQGIVEKEDKHCPLSDQKIAERLAETGVSLSRRTVAKYREKIGLPNADGRKIFV
ncbi:MAG: RNA polymerase factor sigma-54 [Lachnospiraceae bacterium]|nr:RNA polymerase factor sigma-54 [Lachnospiraceae bacterium]